MKHWVRRHRLLSIMLGFLTLLVLVGVIGELSSPTSSGPASSTPTASPPAPTSQSASASPHTAPSHSPHAAAAPHPLALRRVHDPGRVTGSLSGLCHARDDGRLPDRHSTPGAIDPAVTQADIHSTICVVGYTAKVRPPVAETDLFKHNQADPAYGIAPAVTAELDHLVPLELSGANDATNLWPEAGTIPNPKDAVENALRQAVCDGRVSLIRAQRAIARNWLTTESMLGLSSSTAPQPAPAPTRTTGSGAPAGCYPRTSSGHCYEPGEFCPTADHGDSGVAADGRAIRCVQYPSGTWHWKAS